MKSLRSTKSSKPLKIGSKVRTEGDTRFVSTGIVDTISPCGRYAVVVKTYGDRCLFRKHYKTSQLKVL